MNTMKMPGFTAADSLYRTRNHYRMAGTFGRLNRVAPALILGGGNPLLECIEKCVDQGHSSTYCHNICKSGIDAGPTGPDTADCIFCKGGCFAWSQGCKALLGGWGWLCDLAPCDCPSCG